MGNGTKSTPDVAKARPFKALADIEFRIGQATGSGTGAPLAVDYCEIPRRLAFTANLRGHVATGDRVWLRAGDVPYVMTADGGVIGTVTDQQAAAIRQCVIDGYAMSGQVTTFDGESRQGQLEVAGRRE